MGGHPAGFSWATYQRERRGRLLAEGRFCSRCQTIVDAPDGLCSDCSKARDDRRAEREMEVRARRFLCMRKGCNEPFLKHWGSVRYCAAHWKESSERSYAWSRANVARGFCWHCKSPGAIRKGRRLVYCEKHQAKSIKNVKAYVARKKAKGLCSVGACAEKPTNGIRCKTHHDEHVDYVRARRAWRKESAA